MACEHDGPYLARSTPLAHAGSDRRVCAPGLPLGRPFTFRPFDPARSR